MFELRRDTLIEVSLIHPQVHGLSFLPEEGEISARFVVAGAVERYQCLAGCEEIDASLLCEVSELTCWCVK